MICPHFCPLGNRYGSPPPKSRNATCATAPSRPDPCNDPHLANYPRSHPPEHLRARAADQSRHHSDHNPPGPTPSRPVREFASWLDAPMLHRRGDRDRSKILPSLPGSDGPVLAAPDPAPSIALNMPRSGWQVNSENGPFLTMLNKDRSDEVLTLRKCPSSLSTPATSAMTLAKCRLYDDHNSTSRRQSAVAYARHRAHPSCS